MTREEAIEILKSKMDGSVDTSYEWAEAVRMAIEALKAPTGFISKRDAIDALGEEPPVWYDGEDEIAERNQWRRDKAAIESLPSATCDDCIWHTCNYNKVDWDGEDGYISRRDAIDAIEHWGRSRGSLTNNQIAELQREIESLLSAQGGDAEMNEVKSPFMQQSPDDGADLISRQDAIDAMWKALYAYEDLTEKQFMEHEELDLGDWFKHRIFVQRMHEECMKAVNSLPSAEPKHGEWIDWLGKGNEWECSVCKCSIESHGSIAYKYCPNCGADMRGEKHEEQ